MHVITLYDPEKYRPWLSQFVDVHTDRIEQDHIFATFVPPLGHEKLLRY